MATKGEPTHWASATATSGPMSFSVCGVFRERVVALERMLDHEAVCDGCGVVSGMGVVGGGVGDFHLKLVKAFEAECPWTARVHLLNDGALAGEAAEEVRVHIGRCATCQGTMHELGQLYVLQERARRPSEEPPEGFIEEAEAAQEQLGRQGDEIAGLERRAQDLTSAIRRILDAETAFAEAIGDAHWRSADLSETEPVVAETMLALRAAEKLLVDGTGPGASSELRTALTDVLPYAERRAEDLDGDATAQEVFAQEATPPDEARARAKEMRVSAEKATAAVDRAKKLLGVADGG